MLIMSVGVFGAEVLEFALGHLHHVAIRSCRKFGDHSPEKLAIDCCAPPKLRQTGRRCSEQRRLASGLKAQ